MDAVAETLTPPGPAADPRWSRVIARDRTADGLFVFSVRTTGIYCRPSCPARRADPRNVGFHSDGAAARAAGFRPCKRCRPDEASPDADRVAMVAEACRLIEGAEVPPSLAELARAAGLSAHHFHRVFRSATGLTPKGYAVAHRARRLREILPESRTVTEAIYEAGFGSNGRFYAASTDILGMRPREYRSGGPNLTIRFAVARCSLGDLLVARSEAGICAILLGDDPDALVRDLQDRFPRAELIGGDTAFEAEVAQVIGFVEAPGAGLDLPLDLRGTAFQQRVWQALRDIPAGRTATYTDVARRIGAAAAIRAVAGACAANPVAVAVPCHRVVRTDGSLSGYRWGIERKRALLDRERRQAEVRPASSN